MKYLFYVILILTILIFIFTIISIALLLIKKGKVEKTKNELLPSFRESSIGRIGRRNQITLFALSRGIRIKYKDKFEAYDLLVGIFSNDNGLRLEGFSFYGFFISAFMIFLSTGLGLYVNNYNQGLIFIAFSLVFFGIIIFQSNISVKRLKPVTFTPGFDFVLYDKDFKPRQYNNISLSFQVRDNEISFLIAKFQADDKLLKTIEENNDLSIRKYLSKFSINFKKLLANTENNTFYVTIQLNPVNYGMITAGSSELGINNYLEELSKNSKGTVFNQNSWFIIDIA